MKRTIRTTVVRQTDKRARLSLPPSFANSVVQIEQISDIEIRICKVRVIREISEEGNSPLVGENGSQSGSS